MTERSNDLTHFSGSGDARMVDVSAKGRTARTAIAGGSVEMRPDTLARVTSQSSRKGDVLGVARLAGIMAAKKTSELIPLCHPIPITSIEIDFSVSEETSRLEITATVTSVGRTGVEMEALTAVSVAALTVYDMLKSVERGMRIESVRLLYKHGGKSGTVDYR
ncbi:MAG: cyclic pyranopterin monophosphate synthase MoaC [Rhodobacteraceae bacterium]|nr:cyclic pyranopterin monophosphate synthase MoaC [Paracoccaceae bacterium]